MRWKGSSVRETQLSGMSDPIRLLALLLIGTTDGGVILGNGLGTLRDGMLGQLSGEEETDSSLNLSRGDGLTLVVASKTTSLGGDTLKDIINKRVHDSHGLVGDTSIGVNLLENLVDEGAVRVVVTTLGGVLLVALLSNNLLRLGFLGLRGSRGGSLLSGARHGDDVVKQ
jgi:hypothetical protein